MRGGIEVLIVIKTFCALLVIVNSGCFTPYQPYFHNEEDESVALRVEHEGGYVVEGEIGPNSNLASSHPVDSVESIKISYNERHEISLAREEINSVRTMEHFPKFEVWLLSKEGIRLGSKEDWKRILDERRGSGETPDL